METLKKLGAFLGLFFGYIVGSLGSLGYLLYLKEYFMAAFLVLIVIMAFPMAKKWYSILIPETKPTKK